MTTGARALLLLAMTWLCLPVPAGAGPHSLLTDDSLGQGRTPLLALGAPRNPEGGGGASLFAGRAEGSVLAPPRQRAVTLAAAPQRIRAALPRSASAAHRAEWVRHLIARAEAGRAGYDAVQHGARRKPPQRPTRMTIGEIYGWIAATPGQPHAIGRYQFIPATLRRLVRDLGVPRGATFSPELQDRLADRLLEEAGIGDLMRGRITRRTFMNNLAAIWAGLPNSSGRSHYHGYAGNRATMSWTQFEAEMLRIFPG